MLPDKYQTLAIKYFERVKESVESHLLYVLVGSTASDCPSYLRGFRFLGLDFGTFISEDNYFSVVFHEVLFGANEELRAVAVQLNESLLLPSAAELSNLCEARAKAQRRGADVETFPVDEAPEAIAIFAYERA